MIGTGKDKFHNLQWYILKFQFKNNGPFHPTEQHNENMINTMLIVALASN